MSRSNARQLLHFSLGCLICACTNDPVPLSSANTGNDAGPSSLGAAGSGAQADRDETKRSGGAGSSAADSGTGSGSADAGSLATAGPAANGGGPAAGTSGAAGNPGVTGNAGTGVMASAIPATKPGDVIDDWSYYEVEGALCRDGSPAGYYLRKGQSKNLLIYLNGGGVCFDDFFCGINPANVDQSLPGETLLGATLDALGSALAPVRQTPPDEGIFKHSPDNPVSDWSMVFVPYCTGDVYAGTTRDAPVITSTELPPQQFVGYTNLGLFYQTLSTTLGPATMQAQKVLLSGSSAGGFGTLLNYDRTQEFFKASRVYAITDSGFPFRDQYLEPCLQKKWRELWGLDKILPKDCKGCFNADGGGLAEGLGQYIFKEKYKGRMLGGGISSSQDQVMKLFFSAGLNDCSTDTGAEAVASFLGLSSYPEDRYPAGLDDFFSNVSTPESVGAYLIDSDLHQHLFRPRYYEDNGVGKSIAAWIADVLNDQPERLGSTHTAMSNDDAGVGP